MGEFDLSYLRQPFVHIVREEGQPVKTITLTEGHEDFTRLDAVSGNFIKTVIRTEDPRFYRHKGLDERSFGYAILENIRDKKISRGGSTITMQLARNLFLHHRKDLGRKLEEIVLAWLMEAIYEIPKNRMLEIYLNIIEFGPGLYGIKEASYFYFSKAPSELTLTESLVLSYIIPRPKHFIGALRSGSPILTERLGKHTRSVALVLKRKGMITEEEFMNREDHVRFACHPTVISLPQ
jgi:membrane peptidoglycan carboxypeptidase